VTLRLVEPTFDPCQTCGTERGFIFAVYGSGVVVGWSVCDTCKTREATAVGGRDDPNTPENVEAWEELSRFEDVTPSRFEDVTS
jgi:hypothetical protein